MGHFGSYLGSFDSFWAHLTSIWPKYCSFDLNLALFLLYLATIWHQFAVFGLILLYLATIWPYWPQYWTYWPYWPQYWPYWPQYWPHWPYWSLRILRGPLWILARVQTYPIPGYPITPHTPPTTHPHTTAPPTPYHHTDPTTCSAPRRVSGS